MRKRFCIYSLGRVRTEGPNTIKQKIGGRMVNVPNKNKKEVQDDNPFLDKVAKVLGYVDDNSTDGQIKAARLRVKLLSGTYINRLIKTGVIQGKDQTELAKNVEDYIAAMTDNTLLKELQAQENAYQESIKFNADGLGTHFSAAFQKLRLSIDPVDRDDIIEYMTNKFIDTLNNMSRGLNISREQILKGVTIGSTTYNSTFIFQQIYNHLKDTCINNALNKHRQLQEAFEKAKEAKQKYEEGKISETIYSRIENNYIKLTQNLGLKEDIEAYIDTVYDTLENFQALVTLTKAKLHILEGFKFSNSNTKVSSAKDIELLNKEEMEELFGSIEEETRDGWQLIQEQISAFVNASPAVRRLLSIVKAVPGSKSLIGEKVYDKDKGILGNQRYRNPLTVQRFLLYRLRGMKNSNDMMDKLNSIADKHGEFKEIITILQGNNRLKTQFYVAMKKNQIIYSQLFMSGFTGYNSTLNINEKSLLSKLFFTIKNKAAEIKDKQSLLKKRGESVYVTYSGIKTLRDQISSAIGWINSKGKSIDAKAQKVESVLKVIQGLGFTDVLSSEETTRLIDNIAENPKMLSNLKNKLKTLDRALGDIPANFEGSFEDFINFTKDRDFSFIKKAYQEIGVTIANLLYGIDLKGQARYKNSKGVSATVQTDINCSYMGNALETLVDFVEREDREGLQKYIVTQYFKSSMIYDGTVNTVNGEIDLNSIDENKILNNWLKQIWIATKNKSLSLNTSLGGLFYLQRSVGSSKNQDFSEFSAKTHVQDIFAKYFKDYGGKKDEKDNIVQLPVFILGDSGQSKYISFMHQSEEQVLDALWDVYQAENRRKQLQELAHKQGVKIEFFSDEKGIKKADQFALLDFLNDKQFKIDMNEENSSTEVKNKIRAFISSETDIMYNQLVQYRLINEYDKDRISHSLPISGKITKVDDIKEYIRDLIANTLLGTVSQMQLMTSSTAFYPSIKELQKRYKEVHASGTVLDIFARDNNNQLVSESKERVKYFQDIRTTVKGTPFYEALKKEFEDKPSIVKEYENNTLTDGQGFRSLESFKRIRQMLGKWTDDMEAAYNIIMEIRSGNREIDIKELEDVEAVFQPVKSFYYTLEGVPLTGEKGEQFTLMVPVQHKYSEAILIPELERPGSLIRDLAEYMSKNNIDVICSNKCVKVGYFGGTEIKDVQNTEDLKTALDNATTHELPYEGWVEQTNVPLHSYEERLYGTQIKKLAISSIQQNKDYGRYFSEEANKGTYKGTAENGIKITEKKTVDTKGNGVMQFYNALNCFNYAESFTEFRDKIKSAENLSELLIQNALNNNKSSDDFLSRLGVKTIQVEGRVMAQFEHQLFDPSIEHDSQALFFSLFKNIVNKQKIMGSSAVQTTSMGINGYQVEGDLECVVADDNVIYAEGEIPFDLKYTDKKGREKSLNYDDYCDSEGWLLDENGEAIKDGDNSRSKLEKEFPGSTYMIAYRIPTEALYSTINLKIKRFTRPHSGIIKVPHMFTTIAGFDFDIDKLFLMRKEFNNYSYNGKPSFDQYDFSKSVGENSRAARNNMLLHITQQRLADKETFKQRYTPGAFKDASDDARYLRWLLYSEEVTENTPLEDIREKAKDKSTDPEPNFFLGSLQTLIEYNQRNQIADKLIGIFANQNVSHALFQLLGSATIVNEEGAVSPICFMGKKLYDLKGTPESINFMAQLLSASVDAVKDPVLNYLGLNSYTANVGALLVRLGYTHKEVGIFLNQPAIKEVINIANNTGKSITNALIEVFDRIKLNDEDNLFDTPNSSTLSEENLTKAIIKGRSKTKVSQGDRTQIEVLKLFRQCSEVANDLSSVIAATKLSSQNAMGSTYGDYKALVNKIKTSKINTIKLTLRDDSTLTTPISTEDTYSVLDNIERTIENPFAYEETMFKCIQQMLKDFGRYFPYETLDYSNARDAVSYMQFSELDASTIDSVNSEFLIFLLSRADGGDFNGGLVVDEESGATVRDIYTSDYSINQLCKIIRGLQDKTNNAFINSLNITTTVDKNKKEHNTISVIELTSNDKRSKNEMVNGWAQLAISEDPMERALAKNLYKYWFYNQGFKFTFNSYVTSAPIEVLNLLSVGGLTYEDRLRTILATNDSSISKQSIREFGVYYSLNHLTNYKLVVDSNSSTDLSDFLKRKQGTGIINVGNEFNLNVELDFMNKDNKKLGSYFYRQYMDKDGNTFYRFKPVVVIDKNIYVAMGNSGDTLGEVDTQLGMTYKMINKPKGIVYEKYDLFSPVKKELELGLTSVGDAEDYAARFDREESEEVPQDAITEVSIEALKELNNETINHISDLTYQAMSAQIESTFKGDSNYIKQMKEEVKEFIDFDKRNAIESYIASGKIKVMNEKGEYKVLC